MKNIVLPIRQKQKVQKSLSIFKIERIRGSGERNYSTGSFLKMYSFVHFFQENELV